MPPHEVEPPDEKPLRTGCNDTWMWDHESKSPNTRLSGPGQRIAHFHPKWSNGTAGVRGTRMLNNGRYFWELRLSRRIFGTSMMIGIGTDKACLHVDSFTNLLGRDKHGWGLSHKGLLWHDGRWNGYTMSFQENDPAIVGVLFDGIAGTVTYYKDGKCLGVAFRNLNEIKEPLYPIICSTAAKTEMILESMKREFVNLQDRCRAVIAERVQCRKDLEKLSLPTPIKQYLEEAVLDTVKPFKPIRKLLCGC